MRVPEIGHTFALHHNSSFIFTLDSIEHCADDEIGSYAIIYANGANNANITLVVTERHYRWHECLSSTGPDFVLEQI